MNVLTDSQEATQHEAGLCFLPVAGTLGAEVCDFVISPDPSVSQVDQIRTALLDRKVIFFRNQHDLSDADLAGFCGLFDHLAIPPKSGPGPETPFIELTEGYSAAIWHTDTTFMPAPCSFSLLRPTQLPDWGGDTLWADAAAAYRRLPEPLRLLAENLTAIHGTDLDMEGTFPPDYLARITGPGAEAGNHVLRTEHPVVQVHPETGERYLLLGASFKRFVGLLNDESAKIFEVLQSYISRPENTVRWSWRPGDVAMWDNRSCQHRAVPDHIAGERVFQRATMFGKVPTSLDGSVSWPMQS